MPSAFSRLLLPALALPLSAAIAAGAAGPRLVCDAPTFNFGTTSNETSISHTFLLRNEGTATAHVSRVAASCGCIVPDLGRKEIPPGEQTSLRTTFSLAGRQGHQRRVIRVLTDDDVNPSLELWIEGDIARVPLDPETINFGSVLPTDASARTARLAEFAATNRLVRAVSDNTNFAATVTDDGRGIVVRAQPPLPEGVSHATMQLFTDGSATPVAAVPVTAMVVPAVRVQPAFIALPRGATHVTRTVWIRPGSVGALVIREARGPDENVIPLLTSVGAGIYRIDLKNIPVSGALEGKSIVLTTTLPDMPEIEIPFRFDPAP